MRRTLLLSCLLLVTCGVVASAQVWSRVYGGAGFDGGRFIEPTGDGGFFVAGTQSAVAQGPERFYVIRLDSNGMIVWEKTYGKTGLSHTIFAFSKTSDGGFLIGGFTGVQFSGTESALMYRADSNGNVVFERDVNYNDSDHWHVLLQRPEGGYYMGGHTDSKGDPSGDMWLQKLTEDRQVIWEKVYDRSTSEHSHAGLIARNGDVVLLGHTVVNDREKWWVARVDTSGAVRWQKVYGSVPNDHDSPYKTFETREGNFAFIGGSSDPNQPIGTMWLLVVDGLGNIVLDKHYGGAGAQTFSWSGRQTSDGGYVLAGHTSYRTRGQLDMIIVKIDALGNVEWEQKFGGTGYDYGFDVIEVSDGYIVTGYTGSPSLMTGGAGDVYIVKVAKPATVAPGQVTLTSPANASVDQFRAARLVWTSSPNATRYEVQVASDSMFTSIVHRDTNVTSTSDTSVALAGGTLYFWRVRGINSVGAGPWSAVWTFTTKLALPAAVVLVSPAHGAVVPSRDVMLDWEVGQPEIQKYWLEIGFSSAFTTKTTDTSLTETSSTITGLELGKTYWWRVKARNSSGWGVFSEPRSFTITTTTAVTGELAESGIRMSIAPNPAARQASVRFTLPKSGEIDLTLFNVAGQSVATVAKGLHAGGEHVITIDVSTLATGIYALRLSVDGIGVSTAERISVVR